MSRAVLGLSFALAASIGAALGLLAGGGGTFPAPRMSRLAPPLPGPPSFADIVDRVNPGVVHVMVVDGTGRNPHAEPGERPGWEIPRRGEGSGFVVDPEGYLLTNYHLVSQPARIRVRLADKREMPAVVAGADPQTDLALLKVEAEGLQAVPLGDSDRLRVGDWVCAIGNPYRFDHSVTVGVVSSKGRKIWDASFDAYIQTDAAINPGNSGGPLINAAGEAVGINSAVSREGQGIGFAVPINVAREIIEQLRTRGRVTRGYLGIQLHELDPDLRKLVGVPSSRGAVVLDVLDGWAGQAAGLKRYDVITAVSGQGIENGDHLVRTIAARAPGTPVTLTVFRDGRELSLEARLSERAADAGPIRLPPEEGAGEGGDVMGLLVAELGAPMRVELGVPADRVGVVVREVVGLSPGSDALSHGDIVVEVNRKPTPHVAAYRDVLASLRPGEMAWLFVYRPRPPGSFLAKLQVEGKP